MFGLQIGDRAFPSRHYRACPGRANVERAKYASTGDEPGGKQNSGAYA
jgi:hypothetical protein